MGPETKNNIEIHGIGVSPGIALGKAYLIDRRRPTIEATRIESDNVPSEVKRFQAAVEASRLQILDLRRKVADVLHESHARIYDSHLMMMEDEAVVGATKLLIEHENLNAEHAFERTVQELRKRFSEIQDPYLQARVADLDDIYHRILDNLQEGAPDTIKDIESPVVVVANDLTPSDTASMIGLPILAFVTDRGGPTSHAAIMAKALEIPAIVSAENATAATNPDDLVLVDGDRGRITVRPSEARLKRAKRMIRRREREESERLRLRDLPAETLDGYSIELAANVEFVEEAPHVKSHGADGIGLFRTEFLYLNKNQLPDEAELYEVYSKAVKEMAPRPVIFRTVDLGGDKLASYLPDTPELNPYLGLRALRLCLERPEIFRSQLRAILRATAHGQVKIMFPMVTRVEEVRQARQILARIKRELRAEGHAMARKIELGIMIEIPSAALAADILAKHVDFFSIGTNDLIQYTLAVDRVNEKVAHLYDPLHPSVLRLIAHVISAAHEAGIWVGVCGEMAADPLIAALLVGMGVDELSMGPVVIPKVKSLLRNITLSQARELAREALRHSSSQQIRAAINKRRRPFFKGESF